MIFLSYKIYLLLFAVPTIDRNAEILSGGFNDRLGGC